MVKLKGIIATGFFRTGSTFLFTCLRKATGFFCYYEPYHPNIIEHVSHAQKGINGADKDFLEHTLDGNYFEEYAEIDILSMEKIFKKKRRVTNHPVVDFGIGDSDLANYLEFLIYHAQVRNRIPVIQANRLNLCLPWLRRRYKDFLLIGITREPWEVFQSLCKLGRKNGRNLCFKSKIKEFWNVNEAFQNINSYYGFGYNNDKEKISYYEKLYFVMRFIECYMFDCVDLVCEHKNFVLNPESLLKPILSSFNFDFYDVVKFAKDNTRHFAGYSQKPDYVIAVEGKVDKLLLRRLQK